MAISEAVSENRGRGRPTVFDPSWVNYIGNLFPKICTHRGLMNRCYAIHVISLLRDDHAFHWLVPTEEATAGTADLPFALLTELGRSGDDDQIRELATYLCEQKPTAKQAVALLRRLRKGKDASPKDPEATTLALANAIIARINAHLAAHPEATWPMVRDVVRTVWGMIEEAASKNTPDEKKGE